MSIQTELAQQPTATLRRRRTRLFKRIIAIGPNILRGSLIERYIRCGKPGCKCTTTRGHGPKFYLSVSYPGRRPEQQYVPQTRYDEVRGLLLNYQKVKDLFEEISSINRELLRRRETS